MEQRTAERVCDTVRQQVTVTDTVAERVTICDTIRETTTIQLNAAGDTTRRETAREHISDRRRERAQASQQTATSQRSHEAESESREHEAVVEQPKAKPWKSYLWVALAGAVAGILGTIGLIRLIKR